MIQLYEKHWIAYLEIIPWEPKAVVAEISVVLLFWQEALLKYVTNNEPFFELRLRRITVEGRAGGGCMKLRQSSSHSLDRRALLQKGIVLLYYCVIYLLTDI
jgi:hypothetical protein